MHIHGAADDDTLCDAASAHALAGSAQLRPCLKSQQGLTAWQQIFSTLARVAHKRQAAGHLSDASTEMRVAGLSQARSLPLYARRRSSVSSFSASCRHTASV